MNFCHCKDCKHAKRKGKILGARNMGYHFGSVLKGNLEYYFGPVSAYVAFPKFQKGRKRKEKWELKEQ